MFVVCVGLGFCLGRVYALTLIYNLMIRGSQSRSTSRVASHSVSHGSHQHMTTDRHPVDLGMGISQWNLYMTVNCAHTDLYYRCSPNCCRAH
jgi:hypothetical protein